MFQSYSLNTFRGSPSGGNNFLGAFLLGIVWKVNAGRSFYQKTTISMRRGEVTHTIFEW